jgi:two-component system, LuxR family, response regulator FixJ
MPHRATASQQTVYIVDDNSEMRRSVSRFLAAAGLKVEDFSSAEAFLEAEIGPGCLVLDINMPNMTGYELQKKLLDSGIGLPVIIVSGHSVVSDIVKTMKLKPFEYIEKPYDPHFLLQQIHAALAYDLNERKLEGERKGALERFSSLTAREHEVPAGVIAGLQSKAIADKLGLSTSTVDNHRANIMKKLKAATSAELTRICLMADPSMALTMKGPRG